MQVMSHSHLWAGQSLLPVPLFPALSPGLLLYWPAPMETTLSVQKVYTAYIILSGYTPCPEYELEGGISGAVWLSQSVFYQEPTSMDSTGAKVKSHYK